MSIVGDARQMVVATPLPLGPAAPGAPDAGPAAIGAADVWRVVKQRKWLVAITTCTLYLLVGVATLLVYRYAPLYSSDGYIRLIPPAEGLAAEREFMPREYIQHQLGTEAARIKDPDVLLDVLAQPDIKSTEYYRAFGEGSAAFEKCLADLQKRASAAPIRDTYLIRVSMSARNKTEATRIAQTLIDRYLLRSRTTVSDESRSRLEELRNRQASVKKQIQDKRDQIAAARAQRDMPALEQDRLVQGEMVSVLGNTLAELKTRRADVQAQLSTVQGVDPRNLPLSAEMRMIIEADPLLRYYRNQVEQLDVQLATLRTNRLGDKHRVIKELQAQRDSYFEKESSRREELTEDLRFRQIEQLNQELARIDNMMATVREQLTEREAMLKDTDQTIQLLKGWETDVEIMDGDLKSVNAALLELEAQTAMQIKEGRLKLAIAPRDATRPSRPNFIVWLGGGFVLSVLAALGLAFLREFTDQSLRTPLDVARHGHLGVLGCIPRLDDDEADIDQIERATRQAPHSLVSEAFRQVRAHLTFSGPRETQQVLLVTSPRPEDGKTGVAVNLAVTFTQSNERTLLVDCNFRRPAVRGLFANTRAEGLSNILVGHGRLEGFVTHTELPRLDVLASGPLPPNPAELLGSPAMRELLQAARQHYDRIVLDGPPCLLISDALVIATMVDGVVLVARAVHGTKGTLRRAREQLQRINARVIGAVLNGVEARSGGYFREQYREFYGYTDEDVVVRGLPEMPQQLEAGPTDERGEPR